MNQNDEDNYKYNFESAYRKHSMRRYGIVTSLLILVLIALAFVLRYGSATQPATQPYRNAMSTPAETQSDPQLVKQVNDLKAYNVSLQQSVADLTAQRDQAQKDASIAEGDKAETQSKLDQTTADLQTLQAQYDDVYDKYTMSGEYDKLLKREQGYHLSFGAAVQCDTEFGEIVPSALVAIGKKPWEVLAGVGYSMDTSLPVITVGFLWRML